MQKATIGGILTIVASALGGLGMAAYFVFIGWFIGYAGADEPLPPEGAEVFTAMAVMFIVMAVITLAVTALGVVGGVFAIKRRLWGLALTGAIISVLLFQPVGIAAVILVAMAKPEFEQQKAAAVPALCKEA
jgi:hypothetical protein